MINTFLRTLGSLLFFTGRLGRPTFWVALVGLTIGFMGLVISFPPFVILLVPFVYLGFCLLVNRFRDAGLPPWLALTPFVLFVGVAMLYLGVCVLTLGGGGSGTGGSAGMNRLYHTLNDYSIPALGWILALSYLTAGCLPTRFRMTQAEAL